MCDPKDPVHAEVWQHNVDDYCFLAPRQRDRIVHEYQVRVTAAQGEYGKALGEVRVDELLTPDPSQSSWLADLLLDVIGLATMSSVANAFKLLRTAGQVKLSDVVDDAAAATDEIRKASDKQIESVVRQAVTTGKRMFPTKRTKASERKAEDLVLLDHLSRQGPVVYQYLREQALAGVTDAQLLVMREAFEASNGHDSVTYRDELERQVKRYVESAVGKMGVARNDNNVSPLPPRGTDDLRRYFDLETKAFWVELPTGRRLALYRRGHVNLPQIGDPLPLAVGPDRYTAEGVDAAAREDANREFQIFKYVPLEFADIAQELHRARWNEPPSTHAVGPWELIVADWVSP